MAYTLEQRIALARDLRAKGHNCAQCVAMAFPDKQPMSAEQMAAVTVALGTGISGARLTCGAITGMAVVMGAAHYSSPADKPAIYPPTAALVERFKELNGGDALCSDLRQPGRKPCIDLIIDAITLLHETLA